MVYDITWHDDETLQKAFTAMINAGIDRMKGDDAIRRMGNAGILFRETSIGRTISFGEDRSEFDLRQRAEQLNVSLGPDIKSYSISGETFRKIQEEYYRPSGSEPRLRFDPDENPFKKLENERRQEMTHPHQTDKARRIVIRHYNRTRDKSDPVQNLEYEETFVVWFCKTLQNWKALVSTTRPDLTYYEVTYNGDAKETYLDVYVKTVNEVISDLSLG
jgi:hypothetical protein